MHTSINSGTFMLKNSKVRIICSLTSNITLKLGKGKLKCSYLIIYVPYFIQYFAFLSRPF